LSSGIKGTLETLLWDSQHVLLCLILTVFTLSTPEYVFHVRPHQGHHSLKYALIETWEQVLLLTQHNLNSMSLFRSREASGAVVSDYRQLCFCSKVLKETLSAIYEGADNTQITFVNSVIRFHRSQIAVVEGTHYERLS
jgi:hypothetical protein